LPLSTRLVLATGAVIATLVVGMVTVVEAQRGFMIDQLDGQLRGLLPIAGRPPDPGHPPPDPPPELGRLPDRPGEGTAPVEGLLIARVDRDGALTPVITGWAVDDEPAVTVDQVRQVAGRREAFAVDGRAGRIRFRVMVTSARDSGAWGIVALPTTEVDAAIGRLVATLGAVAAVIIVAALLTGWWMVRLGLRPIAQVTRAADAITRGDRGHRVEGDDSATEAGRLARAFNVMLDERDQTEEHLRQFVADAAHELRTPLTSIRGYLDLFHTGAFGRGDGSTEALRRLRRESTRMGSLVEDLLLLASLDHGRPLVCEPVDLADVLRDAADDARAVQPDRTVTLETPPHGALAVTGDEPRLRQVIAELMHNALVHTPRDGAIDLQGRCEGDHVVVTVTDSGAGLPPEAATRVFDRFFRADPSRSRHRGGSGLGLPIARAVVEAHRGTLDFDSIPDVGTTVRLRLPGSQLTTISGH
jgi:two-component system OmpR family sensor kinase